MTAHTQEPADIVARLRSRLVPSWVHGTGEAPRIDGFKQDQLCREAADEIERLRSELEASEAQVLRAIGYLRRKNAA